MKNDSNESPHDRDVQKRLQRAHCLLDCDIEMAHEGVSEIRRLAQAVPHRRGGAGSRDAKKYELGSVLWLHGFAEIDARALTGLLAHPALLLRWIGEELVHDESASLATLLTRLLSKSDRLGFCKQWGRVLEWRYRKPLYDAAVMSFVNSGRTGQAEAWRCREITIDQEALIQSLVGILEIDAPRLKTRGEAFDWIRHHGGNPTFWREPSTPDAGGTE